MCPTPTPFPSLILTFYSLCLVPLPDLDLTTITTHTPHPPHPSCLPVSPPQIGQLSPFPQSHPGVWTPYLPLTPTCCYCYTPFGLPICVVAHAGSPIPHPTPQLPRWTNMSTSNNTISSYSSIPHIPFIPSQLSWRRGGLEEERHDIYGWRGGRSLSLPWCLRRHLPCAFREGSKSFGKTLLPPAYETCFGGSDRHLPGNVLPLPLHHLKTHLHMHSHLEQDRTGHICLTNLHSSFIIPSIQQQLIPSHPSIPPSHHLTLTLPHMQ